MHLKILSCSVPPRTMEPSCSALLDILMEGQEGEKAPSSSWTAPDPKLSFPLQDHAYGCVGEKGFQTWAAGGAQVS